MNRPQKFTPDGGRQVRAEVAAAILRHLPAEMFVKVFGSLPPAAKKRLARQFAPKPTRVIVKITRHRK